MGQSNYVHLEGCSILKITEKAILINIKIDDEDENIWLPKSQIAEYGDNLEEGDEDVTVSITEYIAREKGIDV